jgi:hypothetical protein
LWSPDGLWLAGTYSNTPGSSDGIAFYSIETQQYQKLPNFGSPDVWLPNRRLLVTSTGGIHIVDIESGNVHEVLSLSPDRVFYSSVSRDLRTLYFTRITAEADIWMLTLDEEQ